MKKLVFAFIAVFAMSFVSCGNKTTTNATSVDSDSVADSTLVDTDSVSVDTPTVCACE